jgi:hypothetical protein
MKLRREQFGVSMFPFLFPLARNGKGLESNPTPASVTPWGNPPQRCAQCALFRLGE